MAEVSENQNCEGPAQAISQGRRHLLVRDYMNAVTVLAQGCGMLAEKHGEMADELAEPYLLYGRALLGLSREEQGVLGAGVPGQEEAEEEAEEEGEEEEPETVAEEEKEEGKEEEKVDKEEKSEEKKEETSEKGKDEKVEEKEDKKEEEKEESKATEKEAEKMTNGEATASTSGQANGDIHQNGDLEEEEDADDLENDEDDDANSNLQLAWEVLELAKIILLKRGEAGWKLLAETHRLLGEVAMESGNQPGALTDLKACLDLLRKIEPADPRSMAETHYQLGLAFSLSNDFDESIEQFKEATSLLEMRIKELEDITDLPKSDDPFYSVEGEIKELKELLPEIQEKITDMRDFKAQACKLLIEGIKSRVAGGSCSNGAGPSGASTSGASSSSAAPVTSPKDAKPASDISHLVRKKRKTEDEESETVGSPCKKPSIVSPGKSA